jgi:hypothetical protein
LLITCALHCNDLRNNLLLDQSRKKIAAAHLKVYRSFDFRGNNEITKRERDTETEIKIERVREHYKYVDKAVHIMKAGVTIKQERVHIRKER